jgi:hypothetical protein
MIVLPIKARHVDFVVHVAIFTLGMKAWTVSSDNIKEIMFPTPSKGCLCNAIDDRTLLPEHFGTA